MVHITVTKPVSYVSADTLWNKLALYSDFTWHPQIKSSRNDGSIPDGSDNMVGAVRVLVNSSGQELTETVQEWSNSKRYQTFSIDKGAPPFAKSLVITFQVREDNVSGKAYVDMIVDLQVKAPFCILAPLLSVVLKKKLGPFLEGVANYKA